MNRYAEKELLLMTITDLKRIAKRCGNITGYTKYRASNKDELARLIFKNCIQNMRREQTRRTGTPPRRTGTPPRRTGTPPRRAGTPPRRVPTPPRRAGTPPRRAPTPPRRVPTPPRRTGTPPKTPPKVSYTFKPDEVMKININLLPYEKSDKAPQDSNDITPKLLLKMLKEDDFCLRITRSLKDIYSVKKRKYTELKSKLEKSITSDMREKEKLKGMVDSNTLDKSFPMLDTNQIMMMKVDQIIQKCSSKYREYKSITAELVEKTRQNITDAITNKEHGILSVSGNARKEIRNQLCKQLYILSKGYQPFIDSFLNMVFTGGAGTGKTKLATTVGYVYSKSGILLTGDVIVVSPKDMIANYIGQTATKTAGVLMKGLENIIFIDEAYQLMPCKDGEISDSSSSFGPEAITEIVNFLDKYIGLSIMIVAGYEREITNCFLGANEGLPRRFPIRIGLPPYEITDLLNMFVNTVNKRMSKNIFTYETSLYIYTILFKLNEQDPDIFINQAGDVMNLVSMFLHSYYGTYMVEWGSFDNDVLIVNATFKQFLSNKGYKMNITE